MAVAGPGAGPRSDRIASGDQPLTSTHPAAPLILIIGAPATGKTTLARELGTASGWPVLHRDALKEILLDDWGADDRAASRRIGGTSWSLFHYLLGALAGRSPLIAEANLAGPGIDRILPLLHQPAAAVIHCHAEIDTLHRRVFERRSDPSRHPGHFDIDGWPELLSALDRGAYAPRKWPCPSLLVDTSHASLNTHAAVLEWLEDQAIVRRS